MNGHAAYQRDTLQRYLAAAALKAAAAENDPDPTERYLARSVQAWYLSEADHLIRYLSWRV